MDGYPLVYGLELGRFSHVCMCPFHCCEDFSQLFHIHPYLGPIVGTARGITQEGGNLVAIIQGYQWGLIEMG